MAAGLRTRKALAYRVHMHESKAVFTPVPVRVPVPFPFHSFVLRSHLHKLTGSVPVAGL